MHATKFLLMTNLIRFNFSNYIISKYLLFLRASSASCLFNLFNFRLKDDVQELQCDYERYRILIFNEYLKSINIFIK